MCVCVEVCVCVSCTYLSTHTLKHRCIHFLLDPLMLTLGSEADNLTFLLLMTETLAAFRDATDDSDQAALRLRLVVCMCVCCWCLSVCFQVFVCVYVCVLCGWQVRCPC